MPVGAAGSLIRSVAFFDGGGATQPLIVLAAWIVVGGLIAVLGVRRRSGAERA